MSCNTTRERNTRGSANLSDRVAQEDRQDFSDGLYQATSPETFWYLFLRLLKRVSLIEGSITGGFIKVHLWAKGIGVYGIPVC